MKSENPVLWSPSVGDVASSNMKAFMQSVAHRLSRAVKTLEDLHAWSIDDSEGFWCAIWEFCGVIGERGSSPYRTHPDTMWQAGWFPAASLNFAENLLRRQDDQEAIVFHGEGSVERRLSFKQLYNEVSRVRAALINCGVKPHDRVAGFMPNIPEAVVAMLATASIGAIWSSCSPDFGPAGVIDRFGQIEPKVLFSADSYEYNGRTHDCLSKLSDILADLPTVSQCVVVPYDSDNPVSLTDQRTTGLSEFLSPHQPKPINFPQLAFDHPLYIMFSSGTTGIPKCIVHGAGGTLLQHLKEHQLHSDIKPDDRMFYFTTCGWMMWNWLVTGLASQATILLFDGSPLHPRSALFNLAETEKVTFFGTSAKYIEAIQKAGLEPGRTHNLSALRTIASTGSPLSPESFDYIYEHVKEDVCLSSISGGTDIVSCFVGGNPIGDVRRGEIQARGLGMAVEVFDDEGCPIIGQPGELVCTQSFPSQPTSFWNDPNNARYRNAYFERFDGVWHHGDWLECTERGGFIIHGRSDAVLNPGGVRIGTAEIYRQVERIDAVLESIAVGQDWEGDVRVLLFVKLRDGIQLDDDLKTAIRTTIREHTSPRHVPAVICSVADIPRTRSGKIVELAVRDTIHGRPVRNKEALSNPEALSLFADRAELQS